MIILTDFLGLNKPEHGDFEWGPALNLNMDLYDLAFGPRIYLEQNYIVNNEPHSLSLNKLDVAAKIIEPLMPTVEQKSALIGEGTPSEDNKYATKDYVRLARKKVFFPEEAGIVLTASGTDNTGDMRAVMEVHNNYIYNCYKWLSLEESLQSYDLIFQWRVPDTFVEFLANALIVDVRTESTSSSNCKVDVTITKDGYLPESAVTGICSTVAADWYSEREGNELILFEASDPVLSSIGAGNVLDIRVRMYSRLNKYVEVGAVSLQYTG